MLISEKYIARLQELAGILNEATNAEREAAFANSGERVPFSKDMMIRAIKQGREIGILFKADNEKYQALTSKYRIIYPVAMGLSKKGNLVIRGFHKLGQSEKEALRTGKRSAEIENAWRLFKAENIKSMFETGNFFRGPLEKYNNMGDAGMVNIEVQANFPEIIRFQDEYINNIQDEKAQLQKRKNIVQLFKNTGERPLEEPVKSIATQNQNSKSNNQNGIK